MIHFIWSDLLYCVTGVHESARGAERLCGRPAAVVEFGNISFGGAQEALAAQIWFSELCLHVFNVANGHVHRIVFSPPPAKFRRDLVAHKAGLLEANARRRHMRDLKRQFHVFPARTRVADRAAREDTVARRRGVRSRGRLFGCSASGRVGEVPEVHGWDRDLERQGHAMLEAGAQLPGVQPLLLATARRAGTARHGACDAKRTLHARADFCAHPQGLSGR
jgi:hypothetical protein